MELSPKENKIVKKYMAIHREFNEISTSMDMLKKRSELLIKKLNELRESESTTIKKIEKDGKKD